jgi:hypothetical protein
VRPGVKLLLLLSWRSQLCRRGGFARIHFGGQSDALEIIEIEPGEKDILNKAIKVAEFFLNAGGTAFEPALSQALELISKQGFKKADVVFITDGNALYWYKVPFWFP